MNRDAFYCPYNARKFHMPLIQNISHDKQQSQLSMPMIITSTIDFAFLISFSNFHSQNPTSELYKHQKFILACYWVCVGPTSIFWRCSPSPPPPPPYTCTSHTYSVCAFGVCLVLVAYLFSRFSK